MVTQVLVGGALGVAGLYLGGVAGYGLECSGGCGGEYGGLGGALLGASVGLVAASTTGVVLIGRDRDHDASIALTVVGSVVGGGVSLLLAGHMFEDTAAAGISILAGGTALGGALMYRLTWRRNPTTTAVRLVPFATGSGAGLTLIGNMP